MVEVGSIEIGGTIKTGDIETGLTKIEKGMKNVGSSAKGVESDFERIAKRGKGLITTFGAIAIAGTGALVSLAKGAPALAGAMAKINVSMLKLKMAAGTALEPTFDTIGEGLQKITNWVEAHPDAFKGIVTSITTLGVAAAALKVGGWIYKIFSGFWGILSKIGGFVFPAIPEATTAGTTVATTAGAGAGASSVLGTAGLVASQAILPLINTYQRELTGEPGVLDQDVQAWSDVNFQMQLKKWSRNQSELDLGIMV